MRQPRNTLVIYNPRSGPLTDKGLWLGAIVEKLCSERKHFVTVKATDRQMDIVKIFNSVSSSLDLIIVAGGDGTICSVLAAASKLHPTVPIALVPIGTGNQLARNLGIYEENILHNELESVLQIITKGKKRQIDLGTMNGHFFCVGVGAGPLSDAVAAPSQKDKESWGMLAYVGAVMQTIVASPKEFKITADGDSFHVKANGVFVTNVGDLGITTLSQTASLDDGMLDLCVMTTLNEFSDYVRFGFQIASAILGAGAPYYVRKVRKVRVDCLSKHIPANLDGDFCGTTPMEIEVVPRAVTVLTAH